MNREIIFDQILRLFGDYSTRVRGMFGLEGSTFNSLRAGSERDRGILIDQFYDQRKQTGSGQKGSGIPFDDIGFKVCDIRFRGQFIRKAGTTEA